MKENLVKVLWDMGVVNSLAESRRLIKFGRVFVDDIKITDTETVVNSDSKIEVYGIKEN